jgi:hypothetical protein
MPPLFFAYFLCHKASATDIMSNPSELIKTLLHQHKVTLNLPATKWPTPPMATSIEKQTQ